MVLFHAFPRVLHGGFVGVDVFFVISGFLISAILLRSLDDGRASVAAFYARRVRRIFPALLVVLVSCLVFAWFRFGAAYYGELGKHTAAAAGFMSNLVLWSESGYFDNTAITKPLLHLWSLGVEEQFYLVWPWAMAALWRMRARVPLTLSVLVVTAGSFALNIGLIAAHPIGVFYAPWTRLWELTIGAALACHEFNDPAWAAFPAVAPRRWRDAASLLGGGFLATSVWVSSDARPFPGYWGLLPTVGAALLIAGGPGAIVNRTVLARPSLVWVGLVSYPLYLWHWPLISFATTLSVLGGTPLVRAATVLLSVGLAWMTFRFVERPVRANPRRRTVVLLAGGMVIVGIAGLDIYLGHGVERTGWKALYRYRECFLDGVQEAPAFASECVDPKFPGDPTAPLVVLWGDSHAASLYPGLRHEQQTGGRFRLAQFTASACPPVVGVQFEARPQCAGINDAVLTRIRELSPDVVVMGGAWSTYDARVRDAGNLTRTIHLLEAAGVPRVVFVGELPTFMVDQPVVALEAFTSRRSDRTHDNFDRGCARVDAAIHETVARTAARFVSPIELLCDDAGCLISTSPTVLTPLAWDTAHLTREGSIYLVHLAGLPGVKEERR